MVPALRRVGFLLLSATRKVIPFPRLGQLVMKCLVVMATDVKSFPTLVVLCL